MTIGTQLAAQITTWTFAAVSAVMLSGIASAAEIKVIGSPGTREPYTLLVPGFEKASGHKVTVTWGGVTAVHKRVADGEIADVVMLPAAQIDDLIKQGKLVADSRVNVASSGIGDPAQHHGAHGGKCPSGNSCGDLRSNDHDAPPCDVLRRM